MAALVLVEDSRNMGLHDTCRDNGVDQGVKDTVGTVGTREVDDAHERFLLGSAVDEEDTAGVRTVLVVEEVELPRTYHYKYKGP